MGRLADAGISGTVIQTFINIAALNRVVFLQYLLFEKKNEQAAGNILDDFGDTLNCLKNVAGSLSLCENQRLRALGYHRINFLRHRYFMLYRIEENTVFIDDIFHELQDYENKMK